MQKWDYSTDQIGASAYPVAVVNVTHPASFKRANRDVKCLVDSGADVSGMPVDLLNRLGVGASNIVEVVWDYDRRPREQEFSWVVISLCGKRCGPIKVIRLSETAVPVLGRDVLNQFVATLNGPEQVCEIK
ncbi:MAG: hypothetical protein JW759_10325 [Candidatus Coatesbacteria bacterium]|nr:hypothetical protein [Candidatus Coatesbacteria bacterium]